MPYITASIIIQLLIVVIPKFEQWRDEGAVGQKKLTQVTRYLTIALAVMQSTGLAYVFHNGGGGLLGGGTGLNIDLIPQFTVPRVLLVVLTMTAGTVVVMWLGELITQRGIGQGMSVLIFTNVVSTMPSGGAAIKAEAGVFKFVVIMVLIPGAARGDRLHREGPEADPRHLRQAGGRAADVRRAEHLHPDEGQHRRCRPDHLRQLGPVLPDPDIQRLPEPRVLEDGAELDQQSTWPSPTTSCTSPCTGPDHGLRVLLHGHHLRPAPAGRHDPQAGGLHPRHPARSADRTPPPEHPQPDHAARVRCGSRSSRCCRP